MNKPSVGTQIRFCNGDIATVIAHTKRGFKYKGKAHPYIPRWGLSFTGDGEVFTDVPGWDMSFAIISNGIKESKGSYFPSPNQVPPPPPTTGAILGEKEYQSRQNRLYAAVGEIICHRTLCELCQNHKNYAIDRLFAGKGKPEVFLQALIDYDGMICHAAEWMIDTARKALEDKS